MSIRGWMDEEAVVHINNGILLSHKKECIWIHSNEADEPRAYQTEWNKSEMKNKYHVLTHTSVESRTMELMSLFAGQQWRLRHREQTYGHGGGGGAGLRGGRRWWDQWREQHESRYTTAHKIDSQREFATWLRDFKPGLCNKLEGWERVGGGSEVQEGETYVNLWLIHDDGWQKPNKYCKAIIPQLKINEFLKYVKL